MGVSFVKINCDHCGKKVKKALGHANRAKRLGVRQFCDRACFGKFWRHNKTVKQRKAEKAAYDLAYREKNEKKLKKGRHEWFMKDYAANPEKYRKERQRRMKAHVKYCSQPEYKGWKKKYDEQYRAKLMYGDYAEAALMLKKLESIIDRRMARQDKDCHNKAKKRKRLWKNLQQSTSKKPSGKL